jgi:hypothetical protein
MRNIIALALAAALGGTFAVSSADVAAAATSSHVAWCEQSYRTYDPATDSFIGFDGYAHRCVSPDGVGRTTIFGFAGPGPFVSSGRTLPDGSGNRYNVFPGESDPNYMLNQNQ